MKILLFLLYVLCLVITSSSCPAECQCHLTDKAVDCSGRELKLIPYNIPVDTEVLDLSNNDIEHIYPTLLHNLTKLTDIVLNNNKISKLDPQTFQNLNKLQVIKLAQNFLSSIPEGLFDNLGNLNNVEITDNYITNIHNVFKSSSKLQRLDLHGNSIQELKNPDFRMVPKLVDLNLSQNKISKIEIYVFRPMQTLSSLSMNSNPLKNADRLFSKNRRLSYLDLSECQLKSVPRGIPSSIQHLQLIKNNITKIKPKDFKYKNDLKILGLDENQIEFIGPRSFASLKNLNQLWLNSNKLRKFPSPISSSVTNVYISENNISKLSAADFPQNSLMTELVINENSIAELQPKLFRNLQHLRRLMINGNKITKLLDFTFYGLKNLQLLTLRNNRLDTFEKNCFTGIPSLYELNLSSGLVQTVAIKGNIFENFLNLKVLDVSMSEGLAKAILKSPQMLKSLRTLVELNVMNSNLQTLTSSSLRLLTNLKKIKLAGNRWHCDEKLRWLKPWINLNEDMVSMKEDITCYSPGELRNQRILDLNKSQFGGEKLKTTKVLSTTTVLNEKSTIKTTAIIPTSSTVKTTTQIKNITVKFTTVHHDENLTTKILNPDRSVSTLGKDLYITKMVDIEPVLADGYVSINQTKQINQSDVSDYFDEDGTNIQSGMTNYNLIIIIIATTLSLFVVLVIIIIIVIICRRREKVVYHRALQYHKENGDVVFFVGDLPPCVATLTKPSRKDSRSRSERGSTSSRPNEDITNELDTTMKIYSLDEK